MDSPEKLRLPPREGPSDVEDSFYETLGKARKSILVMTPCFVTGRKGAKFFAAQVARGVHVRIITNSLASTNHAYAHGGYAKYRQFLLEAGVEFLEVRADAQKLVQGFDTPLTMHTKLAIVDREIVFAGSANIVPRSFIQNTELAMVIEGRFLAENILVRVEAAADDYSFTVALGPNGKLIWRYNGKSGSETFDNEPGARLLRRWTASIAGWLPIENQL